MDELSVKANELIKGNLYLQGDEIVTYEGKATYGKHVFRYQTSKTIRSWVEMLDHQVPRLIKRKTQ